MSLLGGLLGGLGGGFGGGFGGGLGGGLRGMMGSRRQSGSMSSPQSSSVTQNRDAPLAEEPQEQPQQVAQKEEPQPEQQPAQAPPPVQQVAAKVAEPVSQQQAEKASPLSNLLDEAPSTPSVDSSGTTGGAPAAPTVVNRTPTMTPVAAPAQEQVGVTPQPFRNDGVLAQLMESGNNRQPTELQEGMPSRTPAIEDRQFQFQGPSSVAGALPSRRYRMRA